MRVKWCPEAEEALQHALSALRSGLLVRSWRWAVEAVEHLDAATVQLDQEADAVAVDQGDGAS